MTANQFTPLRDAWSSAASTSVQSRPLTCPHDVAMRRAAILLGCFRKGEAEDPEIYVASVAAMLSIYPQEIVYRVTDPRTGLPGKMKWLPSVAEVRQVCEREMEPIRIARAREAKREETRHIVDARARSRVPREAWTRLRQDLAQRDLGAEQP